MKYFLMVLSSILLFGSVFAQENYEGSKLDVYIDVFALEHTDRLPELGIYLASLRTNTLLETNEYIVLTHAINDISTHLQRVNVPAGYNVVPTSFLKVMRDAFAVTGWSQAPIWIIEFADFQCPYCQQQANNNVLDEVLDNNPGVVRTSFGQFPLGGEYHQLAQSAAVAMECVHVQTGLDAALQFKRASFSTSLQPTLARMREYVRDISGVDEDVFSDCVENNETIDSVLLQKQIGIQLGVRGTPYTTIVDTRSGAFITVGGAQTVASLQKHIDLFMAQ